MANAAVNETEAAMRAFKTALDRCRNDDVEFIVRHLHQAIACKTPTEPSAHPASDALIRVFTALSFLLFALDDAVHVLPAIRRSYLTQVEVLVDRKNQALV